MQEVLLAGLKAVFFMKSFDGDPAYRERTGTERTGLGKKLQMDINDGEILVGYSQGFTPSRPGLFVTPRIPKATMIEPLL